jgi:hypothetical protein
MSQSEQSDKSALFMNDLKEVSSQNSYEKPTKGYVHYVTKISQSAIKKQGISGNICNGADTESYAGSPPRVRPTIMRTPSSSPIAKKIRINNSQETDLVENSLNMHHDTMIVKPFRLIRALFSQTDSA